MTARHRFFFWLRDKISGLAHRPWAMDSRWHDRLEFVAYRIIDPLIWI